MSDQTSKRLTAYLLLLLACALLGGGCHEVYLSDDIDLELRFSLLSGPSDELHLPYVVGTRVTIRAHHSDPDESTARWRLVSSAPSVLRIDSQDAGQAVCTAVAPGETTVRIYPHAQASEPIHSARITVRAPNRTELYAYGPLLLGEANEAALVQDPLILVDGTATFLVRYFADDTRLYGNGVLRTRLPANTPVDTITVVEQTTFLFENREWLQITPHRPDPFSLELVTGEQSLGTVEVHGVPSQRVDHIELHGQDESAAKDGAYLIVLAQAYTASGRPIFGADFAWELEGEPMDGLGDLFRYTYREDSPIQLGASLGQQYNAATINASEGYVSSTNTIGCTMAPGAARSRPVPAPLALLVLAPVFVLISRRTRARASCRPKRSARSVRR